MRREYELRRNFVVSGFNEMGWIASGRFGSFYVLPEHRAHGADQPGVLRAAAEGKERCRGARRPALAQAAKGSSRACYATSFSIQLKDALRGAAASLKGPSLRPRCTILQRPRAARWT